MYISYTTDTLVYIESYAVIIHKQKLYNTS
jgi:hypothetical protein